MFIRGRFAAPQCFVRLRVRTGVSMDRSAIKWAMCCALLAASISNVFRFVLASESHLDQVSHA
jgi:hypothetical protein